MLTHPEVVVLSEDANSLPLQPEILESFLISSVEYVESFELRQRRRRWKLTWFSYSDYVSISTHETIKSRRRRWRILMQHFV